ncbi:LLM class flavin-dependent oxidoreductase [Nguyenibacter sp. L1]|uniref:LLM class flavin-dependent oxidoreductase n=1 Tax=Nguyenibacter sp. L1 TaxID=3049350 RepID=UPI002B496288|nr:LLM class flavin-dependent oxidoreductase [Nguyenibacter sp. L1]WRH87999.1 LLM class flavin-dependent oxidoreductase [Nguyenibacter sp. L1]
MANSPGLPRWDTFTLLAALAVTSRHIGLIGTASTTFNEPYNLARRIVSLDRLSGGRAGWNVVTATGGGENFNLPCHVDHAGISLSVCFLCVSCVGILGNKKPALWGGFCCVLSRT